MSKYRKKSVIIEAIQFDGVHNLDAVKEFCGKSLTAETYHGSEVAFLHISTLEGDVYAYPEDYIIRGVKGEIYPCKPDIFEQTYTQVDEETERECKGYKTEVELEAYDDGYFDGFVDGLAESRGWLLEIIDKHISSWSGKRYGHPTVMAAIEDLRRDVLALKGDK